MEDRKRPATSNIDDLAPPSKKASLNGGAKARDDDGDVKPEQWIEEYQKDAILRQMQDYKRQLAVAEARVEELQKTSHHYEDHLRVLDLWWLQLLQEVQLVAQGSIELESPTDAFPVTSGLTFEAHDEIRQHLNDKGDSIKSSIQPLFSRLNKARGDIPSEVSELESQVRTLLADHKQTSLKLQGAIAEKDSLSDQLNAATLRYFKSEKKLERAKSAQVQKLEQAALARATAKPTPAETDAVKKEEDEANGVKTVLATQLEEAEAVANSLRQQLDASFADQKILQEAHSTLKMQNDSTTDDAYSRTDVYKQFRNQNEDLIKRINHLESTNRALREEAEKMRSERSSFKSQLEREAQNITGELEDQVQQKEQDLTRIRSARDELLADQGIRKACQDQDRSALEHVKELLSAQEERTFALESQLERLKPATEDVPVSQDIASMSAEALQQKLARLNKDFESINKELPSMEKAYKKAMGLASKKVMDFARLEEKVQLLTLEKNKADQKYFAARKDADIRINEIKTLRQQNGKSSEIIAQLKDAESQARMVVGNLEKQLTELKQTNAGVMDDNRLAKAASADATRKQEAAQNKITELSNNIRLLDSAAIVIKHKHASQEGDMERLKVKLRHMTEDRDKYKAQSISNSSDEEEMLRGLALCSICRNNFKQKALKTCGHVFCASCIDDRIASRMRKCPNCSKPFDKTDVMPVHL